jgi:hypothetical protein
LERLNWKVVAEFVAISAIVGSLIFVGLQIKLDRQIADVERVTEFADGRVQMADLISNNAEIWIGGLNGDELSESDYLKFAFIAQAFYTQHFGRYRAARITGTSEIGNTDEQRSIDYVVHTYATYLYQYPGLRRVFNEHGNNNRMVQEVFEVQRTGRRRGTGGFRGEITTALADLDDRSPPTSQKTYVIY